MTIKSHGLGEERKGFGGVIQRNIPRRSDCSYPLKGMDKQICYVEKMTRRHTRSTRINTPGPKYLYLP